METLPLAIYIYIDIYIYSYNNKLENSFITTIIIF